MNIRLLGLLCLNIFETRAMEAINKDEKDEYYEAVPAGLAVMMFTAITITDYKGKKEVLEKIQKKKEAFQKTHPVEDNLNFNETLIKYRKESQEFKRTYDKVLKYVKKLRGEMNQGIGKKMETASEGLKHVYRAAMAEGNSCYNEVIKTLEREDLYKARLKNIETINKDLRQKIGIGTYIEQQIYDYLIGDGEKPHGVTDDDIKNKLPKLSINVEYIRKNMKRCREALIVDIFNVKFLGQFYREVLESIKMRLENKTYNPEMESLEKGNNPSLEMEGIKKLVTSTLFKAATPSWRIKQRLSLCNDFQDEINSNITLYQSQLDGLQRTRNLTGEAYNLRTEEVNQIIKTIHNNLEKHKRDMAGTELQMFTDTTLKLVDGNNKNKTVMERIGSIFSSNDHSITEEEQPIDTEQVKSILLNLEGRYYNMIELNKNFLKESKQIIEELKKGPAQSIPNIIINKFCQVSNGVDLLVYHWQKKLSKPYKKDSNYTKIFNTLNDMTFYIQDKLDTLNLDTLNLNIPKVDQIITKFKEVAEEIDTINRSKEVAEEIKKIKETETIKEMDKIQAIDKIQAMAILDKINNIKGEKEIAKEKKIQKVTAEQEQATIKEIDKTKLIEEIDTITLIGELRALQKKNEIEKSTEQEVIAEIKQIQEIQRIKEWKDFIEDDIHIFTIIILNNLIIKLQNIETICGKSYSDTESRALLIETPQRLQALSTTIHGRYTIEPFLLSEEIEKSIENIYKNNQNIKMDIAVINKYMMHEIDQRGDIISSQIEAVQKAKLPQMKEGSNNLYTNIPIIEIEKELEDRCNLIIYELKQLNAGTKNRITWLMAKLETPDKNQDKVYKEIHSIFNHYIIICKQVQIYINLLYTNIHLEPGEYQKYEANNHNIYNKNWYLTNLKRLEEPCSKIKNIFLDKDILKQLHKDITFFEQKANTLKQDHNIDTYELLNLKYVSIPHAGDAQKYVLFLYSHLYDISLIVQRINNYASSILGKSKESTNLNSVLVESQKLVEEALGIIDTLEGATKTAYGNKSQISLKMLNELKTLKQYFERILHNLRNSQLFFE